MAGRERTGSTRSLSLQRLISAPVATFARITREAKQDRLHVGCGLHKLPNALPCNAARC
jgi:hypothetical protein